jgi:hypothetical protein
LAVDLDQIECEHDGLGLDLGAPLEALEDGAADLIWDHHLAVDAGSAP